MKKFPFIFVFSLISFFTVFSFSQPTPVKAAACPNPGDTKVYVSPNNNLCYSATDPLYNTGLNTLGGSTSTCGVGGQVRCPGSTTNLPNGNLCIVKKGTQCFPGYGTSGVNTPDCTAQTTIPLPRCPSPMDLTIKVLDAQKKGVPNITVTVTYEDVPSSTKYIPGKTTTAITDGTGTAVIKNTLYSGDHFSIKASNPGFTITPSQIGNLTNVGHEEMNTTFSCGTQLENGQSNAPCTFTATANTGPPPTPTIAITDDPTVDSAFNSVGQTLIMLGVVATVGIVVIGVGNGGKL